MKKWIAILMIVLTALCAVACDTEEKKDENADSIVGTWVTDYETTMAGLSAEEKAMMEQYGATADSNQVQYTFKADGTGSASINLMGESNTVKFTYTAKDGKLVMTVTDDGKTETASFDYEINDKKLVLSDGEDGEIVTLKRK